MGYIRFPIETNPDTLAQEVYDAITSLAPGWAPNDANLDVWIIKAMAAKAAENRDLASDVQDDIFRFFGSTIMGIPPVDAVSATGQTTWTMIDAAGYTIPAGTLIGMRNPLGELIPFQTTSPYTVSPGTTVTPVGDILVSAVNPGIEGNTLTGPIEIIDLLAFVSTVTIVGSTAGGIDEEDDATYLDRLTRRMKRLSQRPILPQDFADMALDASTTIERAIALDGYNADYNALSANAASMETDSSAWVNVSNATVASSSAQAADGAKSVSLTAVAAADMVAQTTAAASVVGVPFEEWTAIASFRANAAVRNCQVAVQFYTAADAFISEVLSAQTADVATGWTQLFATAIAPATTAKVRVKVVVKSAALGEVHYVDKASLHRGPSTGWSAGGSPETGNERYVSVAGVTSTGANLSAPVRATLQAFLDANREINFVVGVTDAIFQPIDVTASIKVLIGFTPSAVQAAVLAALNDYLDPSKWGRDPRFVDSVAKNTWIPSQTVYYNELISLVSSVDGVDRVTDLTFNKAGVAQARVDVPLPGPVALTDQGAIVVNVV